MILTRVDFPAPFSPIRATTSPGKRSKLTPLSARTPGKRLLMLESAKHGSRLGRVNGCVTAASRRRSQAARLLKTHPVATGEPLFARSATRVVRPTSSPRSQRGFWRQSNQNCAAYFSMFDLSKTRRLFRNVLFSASIFISPRRPILTVLPTSGFSWPRAMRLANITPA
jgi:hypothetical protein